MIVKNEDSFMGIVEEKISTPVYVARYVQLDARNQSNVWES